MGNSNSWVKNDCMARFVPVFDVLFIEDSLPYGEIYARAYIQLKFLPLDVQYSDSYLSEWSTVNLW